jgi:SAM-dependent methyltransferase
MSKHFDVVTPFPSPAGLDTMSSAMPDAVKYHRWILQVLRRHVRGGPLLEVGPGYGQYTGVLAGWVSRLLAVDLSPTCIDDLRALAPNVEARVADLADDIFVETVGKRCFDHVVCLNVLEHVEEDVRALVRLREVLRPGGVLLLLVPAHSELYGPMDRLAGHFRRYTKRTLAERLARSGFAAESLRYFNPVGAVGWWVNARFFRPRSLSDDAVNRQILLFDRYVLPISRALDPLTRALFGQSLWAVARPRG